MCCRVAFCEVQNSLEVEYPVFFDGNNVTFSLDIPLTYFNVLADPKFQDYSLEPFYQTGELG